MQNPGKPVRLQSRSYHKDGSLRWFDLVVVNLLHDPAVKAIIRTSRDITELVQVEQALRTLDARLQVTLDSAQQGFYLLDRNYRLQVFNRVAWELYRAERNQELTVGHSFEEYVLPLYREEIYANFCRALAGESFRVELVRQNKSGYTVWFEGRLSPVLEEDGTISGVCYTAIDITAPKRAELQLQRQRDYLETLHQITLQLINHLDLHEVLNSMAQSAAAILQADRCGVMLLNETKSALVLQAGFGVRPASIGREFRYGIGLAGMVWQAQQVVKADNYYALENIPPDLNLENHRAYAAIGIPLINQEEFIGAFTLSYATPDHTFSSEEIEILERFAQLAVLALENARHYTAAQTELAERKKVETSLRRREAQLQTTLMDKEVLLKEVHHRVKNNLQIISSLLKLQSNTLPGAQTSIVLEESRQRVRSIALIHEKLYQSTNFSRVNFGDYLKSLVTQLLRTYRNSDRPVKFKLEQNTKLFLNLEQAIPCGLLVNELVTNALKYAFSVESQSEPLLQLTLQELAEGWIRLGVADNGVGLPPGFDFLEARSLGLQLVQMLAAQLKGKAEFSPASEGGTSFQLLFQVNDAKVAQANISAEKQGKQ